MSHHHFPSSFGRLHLDLNGRISLVPENRRIYILNSKLYNQWHRVCSFHYNRSFSSDIPTIKSNVVRSSSTFLNKNQKTFRRFVRIVKQGGKKYALIKSTASTHSSNEEGENLECYWNPVLCWFYFVLTFFLV